MGGAPCCQEVEKFLPEQEDEERRAADPSPRGTESAVGPPVTPSTTSPLTSINKHTRAESDTTETSCPPPKKNQCNYSELKSLLEKRVGDVCDTASPVRRPRVRCVRAAGPRAATPCSGVHSFPHEREGSHTEVTARLAWLLRASGVSGSPAQAAPQAVPPRAASGVGTTPTKTTAVATGAPLDTSLPAVHPNIVSNIESDCKTALQK